MNIKETIYTKNAPEPVGPYSQAVKVGNVVYLSGQIGTNPKTGELNNASLEDEAKQVLENLSHVLEAAGATVNDVVRTDIFLANINDFAAVNTLYGAWLGDAPVKPARQTVEVSKLPKGVRLEISCVAHVVN